MPSRAEPMPIAHAAIRREAEVLAGSRGDLRQRAIVYHHLFRHSGGAHAFPLLAAHGALWGRGYFAAGARVGRALSLLDLPRPARRRARLAGLAAFADAFREINRRVCVEVYATYHFTAAHGEDPGADGLVDPVILDALNRCHRARRAGRRLARGERRALFEAFFLWEQRAVVGPAVDAAVAGFDWPLLRDLALKPAIRFAYIPRRDTLRFADFADLGERVEKGLRAFEIAEDVGLDRVEAALAAYGVLPPGFAETAGAVFDRLRGSLLAPSGPAVAAARV